MLITLISVKILYQDFNFFFPFYKVDAYTYGHKNSWGTFNEKWPWLLLVMQLPDEKQCLKKSLPMPGLKTAHSTAVTYWPLTELSIKKQVHLVEDVEDITLTCGQVEFSAHATPTGSRWASNNYITGWISWSQLLLEFKLQFEAVRTSSRQRACGPQWPLVEQPSRMRKKWYYSQRNLGSICCSLFRLQLTSQTQPFRE